MQFVSRLFSTFGRAPLQPRPAPGGYQGLGAALEQRCSPSSQEESLESALHNHYFSSSPRNAKRFRLDDPFSAFKVGP